MMGIPKHGIVVAIDGPAGTGKSTVTKLLCDRLGFTHIDTGALYRAIAYLAAQKKTGDLDPESAENEMVDIARRVHLEFRYDRSQKPSNRVLADGKDITPFLRTPEISAAASRVSAIPGVRSALLGLQRRLGCAHDSILEGRDIGTVIFPDADLKFFLLASSDERARRRQLELQEAGTALTIDEVRRQLAERDHADSTRSVAPLKKADDAIEVDTTTMSIDQVIEELERRIRSYSNKRKKA